MMNVQAGICLLLLYAQFAHGLSDAFFRTFCPTSCSCRNRDYLGGFSLTSVTVDCHSRTADVDHEQLEAQLDTLLSSNWTHSHLA